VLALALAGVATAAADAARREPGLAVIAFAAAALALWLALLAFRALREP
jgi:multisubunit Na+/H+ antiporter MnhB subunit